MSVFDDFDDLMSNIISDEPFEEGIVSYRGRIGVEDAARLAEALRGNFTITWLDLVAISLGDDEVKLLAAALSDSSITQLVLSYNSIGDKGARALAAALPSDSSLGVLCLNNNSIGPGGAMALAEGLLENSSVTELYLDHNNIGNDVARALLWTLLRGNSTVTYLGLRGSDVSEGLERMARELLDINCRARHPREALERKIEWLADLDEYDARLLRLERGLDEAKRIRVETEIGWNISSAISAEDEAAVFLALTELGSYPRLEQRQRLFGRLLGSPKHGVRVASSVGEEDARVLYRKAAECGARLNVLMNLLRAHPSLCMCRDVKQKLYPFMLLATMSEACVDEVMELLLQSPTLVQGGISGPAER